MNHVMLAATRSLRNLLIPGMFKLLLGCFLLTLLGLAVFMFAALELVKYFTVSDSMLADEAVSTLIGWGGPLVSSLTAWFLFPLVMPVIVSFFDEYIADKIERHEYPRLAIGTGQPFWPDLKHDILFTLKALLLNLLALPFYLLPPFNLFIYYLLNGYLLGKEFFVIAAGRHLGKPEAYKFSRRYRWTLLLAGIGIVFLATVPFVNLIAPFWGVAMMVHLYQILADIEKGDDKQEILPPPTIEP